MPGGGGGGGTVVVSALKNIRNFPGVRFYVKGTIVSTAKRVSAILPTYVCERRVDICTVGRCIMYIIRHFSA